MIKGWLQLQTPSYVSISVNNVKGITTNNLSAVIRQFQGINLLLFSLEFRSGVINILNQTIYTF